MIFSLTNRTNRQSKQRVFYFLHTLFFLHIYTAFLTIANALNNHENEAFIQLSIDSIHIVKPSDPRISSIEENANDNEEKELLIALLASFDDDYTKQNDDEKSLDSKYNDDVISTNNSTSSLSSSSTVATASSSTASSSIRFLPSLLNFGEQPIAIPRVQTVTVINDDVEPLELQSLSGTTVQFYSSFFTQKTLAPNGGNTSINVYYLPRTVGIAKSTFTIKTNRRIVNYYVHGVGTPNPFHIRPLIGATLPFNSTFECVINFYNPYNYSIDINEVYTSDENLIIELLSHKNKNTKIIKAFEHKEQWHIEPFRNQPIIKINYLAYKLDRLHGFFCIKTSSNDTIIAPVEINVSNQLKLYSNVDILEFSPDGYIRSTARPIIIPVYVINNGIAPVTISNIRVTATNTNYTTISFENVQVPSGIHHLTKIADITIHPHLVPTDVVRVRGSLEIYASASSSSSYTSLSESDEPALRIPFRATVLHGSLDYDREATFFYIPSSSLSLSSFKDECRPLKFINRFKTTMVIYNVTADKTGVISQFMNLKFFAPYVYAYPGQSVFPLCVNPLKTSISSPTSFNVEASLTLHTNLSFFHMPIYLYSGLLNFDLVTDSTNGGIKRNDLNPLEYYIASIPVNVSRTVKFLLKNLNPIDIPIEKISLTLPKANIRFSHLQYLNGSETKAFVKPVYYNEDITDFVIPSHHLAVFALIIHGTSDPSFYDETIIFKTLYQTLNINVKYRIISGSIDIENKLPLHIDVFPTHLGVVDVSLHNRFDEPTEVLRIEFPTFGKSFSFAWNNTGPGKLIIEANKTYQIGKLSFDMKPLCNSIPTPSESTCYCGVNNHPEFKQQWNQHVATLNNEELDHILVSKFRNLWNDWTSLVRKQRIQTNIWLVTDQANVSWPVTIGFVWPSVLEHMSSALSRTPVVLDFHLTLINTTKTHNVIITNPSSNVIRYSIELVGNFENTEKKMKRNSNNNIYHVFEIATTSKGLDYANGVYKFNLLPNEHIIFTASYRPKLSTKNEMYIVVRNNLTILESVLLRGEGGRGSLTVGNRKAGSSDIPLVLEMNEKQYKLCSDQLSTDGTRGYPVIQKTVTIRNTGNMKAIIQDIAFGNSKCSGQGFSVQTCTSIEIEPNERYDLRIRFQPDYTLAEIAESLTLHTNIGLMTYPIIVRIPQRILATCYQTIPRPIWETSVHWFCLCSVSVILLCILTTAIYEARRLFYDYVARAELRSRMSSTNRPLFEFTDITTAVQVEQKNRERLESRSSISGPSNSKKDTSNDEVKPKEPDTKAKRPSTSLSSSKDAVDISTKVSKTSDGNTAPVRSVSTSSKTSAQKPRRSTTDSGTAKPYKQQQQPETSTKSQSSRTQKSSAVMTSRSPSPPPVGAITSISDSEKEPFVLARSKRLSFKTKDTTAGTGHAKQSVPNDEIVSAQLISSVTQSSVSNVPSTSQSSSPTPPSPHLPTPSSSSSSSSPSLLRPLAATSSLPITTTSETLHASVNGAEKRHEQHESLQETEFNNDQQWHKVGPSRSSRKGSNGVPHRREPADETHATSRTNKAVSGENPVVSPSSSSSSSRIPMHASNPAAQSRRRRGRRLTNITSPTQIPILTKGNSSQADKSFNVQNRELAFRQLAEHLWAAGLPSGRTACSMSVRSRCSSAPPSERGGDDDMKKLGWNNGYDDEEDNIDWDEPEKPDEDFTRFGSLIELSTNEPSGISETTKQPLSSTINDVPSLSMRESTSIQPDMTIPSAVVDKDLEPIRFPPHGPGPIQRPNKLATTAPPPTVKKSFIRTHIQSPDTPDALDHLKLVLENSNGTGTPTIVSSARLMNDPSMTVNDLPSTNVAWTPYSPSTWPSRYDFWSLTGIQSPAAPLGTHVQNPFTLMSPLNEQQRQVNGDESTVWSSMLGTATPRFATPNTRTNRDSTWNELFSSAVPTSTEAAKPHDNSSWLKYYSSSDSSSTDAGLTGGQPMEANNPFWNSTPLNNEPVMPRTLENHPSVNPAAWWSNASSDENNNNNNNNNGQINRLSHDAINNRDQSRWDFARER